MLETLRERKAALEAQGKKGFTLMEMLIVIAIIAILIAIAIPIFTAQLEKAGESADAANVRAEYAEVMAAILEHPATAIAADDHKITLQQGQDGWQNTDIENGLNALKTGSDGGVEVAISGTPKAGKTATISYETGANPKVTITFVQS